MDVGKLPQLTGFAAEGEVFDPRAFLLASVTATEASAIVNHVHLWDVLPPKSEGEHQVLAELATQVAAIWRAALREAFPDRQFTVTDETADYGPTVSFHSATS